MTTINGKAFKHCPHYVTLAERFWQRVAVVGPDDCWNWTKGCSAAGYGQLGYKNKVLYSHRVAYELANGKIPDGLFVCHKCDNPQCCNPTHLFLGTCRDNAVDMAVKERSGATKLTADTVREIMKLREEGLSYKQIATRINSTMENVGTICSGRAWNHVTGLPRRLRADADSRRVRRKQKTLRSHP